MKMVLLLETGDIRNLQYQVVVEMWHHAVGHSATGRNRRLYHAEFTPAERKRAREVYNLFYKWYLITGPPQTHTTTVSRYRFMQRVCNFFGGL